MEESDNEEAMLLAANREVEVLGLYTAMLPFHRPQCLVTGFVHLCKQGMRLSKKFYLFFATEDLASKLVL